MCGIAGFWNARAEDASEHLKTLAKAMGQAIHYRGPDSDDQWVDRDAGIALAHRRLAIVDLSAAGAQPMLSSCGRYVIVYNGEVYNAEDLRQDLGRDAASFRGHSDTEVILEAFSAWGVEATVKKLIGMFAFALWDRQDRRLCLGRDRLGIKPLYWSLQGKILLFGSEVKALHTHPACPKELDRNALASFLRYNYIPGPYSVYQNVQKLQPGHMVSITLQGDGSLAAQQTAYWSMSEIARQGLDQQADFSDEDAISALEEILGDAVERRMIADVPLGALLSGGIDSSAVAALMQAKSTRPIRTFSIGFHEEGYNEAHHAAAIAKHLKTDHTELYVTPEEAQAVIPQIPTYYDEPFSDSSQIPTYLVSKMAREHVTVVLSGDGGDELFGGYNRYFTAAKYGRTLFSQPKALRQLESAAFRALSPNAWTKLSGVLPKKYRPPYFGDKLYKLADVLEKSKEDFYARLVSAWDQPNDVIIGGREYSGPLWDQSLKSHIPDYIDRMMYLDTITYMPDDILTKVDRASMAVSLEARVPLLDHRVVEFAWRLPQSLKIREGQGKWILRQMLYRHVPKNLIERPKMGFGVPIDAWLRGPLRDWAEDLLSPQSLQHFGLLKPELIQKTWRDHLSGHRNWQYHLWHILMLQAWCRQWH